MRVTEHYGLPLTQSEIDFVDVDVTNDVELFVDPTALLTSHSDWAQAGVARIQSFFQIVLDHIRSGHDDEAKLLLAALNETNETHLGYSTGRSRGSGVGRGLAEAIWNALKDSRAVQSGLIQDLEDTALFIEKIRFDRISDLAVAIIREQLLEFTLRACQYYGIPLEHDISSGPIWDPHLRHWRTEYMDRPVVNGLPLLLVPKAIIRQRLAFNADEYYTHYILNFLIQDEYQRGGGLVRVLKNGQKRVFKKDVEAHYPPNGKRTNVEVTISHPEILDAYRENKIRHPVAPLDHESLDEDGSQPDWNGLLRSILNIPPGRADADLYHRSVEALLSALFYPSLIDPVREFRIHDGRKRIDIRYVNDAQPGFFGWLAKHYPSSHIFVECKNYGAELANPEFDQLAGRFSPNRGRVGLLVHRGFGNKEQFMASCHDTAADDRGFILLVDDNDLGRLVEERSAGSDPTRFGLLYERFQYLIS